MSALADTFMKQYDVPGVSVAITQRGHLVYAEGFGVADKRTGERVTSAHLFRIASISKPITSVGIFSLVEAGKLQLSDKVFGPDGILGAGFQVPSSGSHKDITVAHLLTHLGGGWANKPDDPMSLHKTMDQQKLIAWTLANKRLDHRPGAHFAYSNFGYCVLGRIIERVSNQRYDEYIRSSVLERCGITGMKIAGSLLSQRAENEVVYHHRSWDPYALNMSRNDATGGWIGSAVDLVRFATHVDGFPHSPDILAPATVRTMATATSVNPRYAHGWAVLKGNWRHDGRLPGTTSAMVRTQSGYCWAALANSSSPNSSHGLDNMVWDMISSVERWSPGELPRRQ